MRIVASLAFVFALTAASVSAQELRTYVIAGDAIPDSLSGQPGDAERGRAIVANRTVGLCLLCHSGPFPEQPLQGTLAPSLAGAGGRNTAGQLRLRLVNPSRLVPDTIMPPYYRLDRLQRVARTYEGKTILSADQIEDVVAYLMTLKE
jgi:sulfur-oxidizing protein SoxX